ncbi:hypothetical protein [Neobacillus drentensis]|uniref:hypothetical protein n=1 Tax=Neobacillus drentensis TaxID=220684 RepID=UPI000824C4CE|nr:hypothetical protein [Neobacillus drentensis]
MEYNYNEFTRSLIKTTVKQMTQISRYQKALGWTEKQVVENLIAGARKILALAEQLEEEPK